MNAFLMLPVSHGQMAPSFNMYLSNYDVDIYIPLIEQLTGLEGVPSLISI